MGARAWRANRVAPCGRGGGRPRTWLRWEWRNAVRVARNPTGAPETAPVLGSRDARRGVRLSAPRRAALRSLPAGRVFTRAYTNTPASAQDLAACATHDGSHAPLLARDPATCLLHSRAGGRAPRGWGNNEMQSMWREARPIVAAD